ncbi:hypothetical protein [Flavobacterium sp. Root901]|uniref:hypothetical protein n=1 Tax=Flavobacterium sp. Root901 TaxID=1736605 RepID=UPI000AD6044E|nr:hypothetical protein [Flavobacterium sp. Root901]
MKTLLKTKVALLILLAGLAFSCKKNETPTESPGYTDSTEAIIDTVGPEIDSTVTDTVTTIKTDSIKK